VLNKTILVVDDNEDSLDLISEVLAGAGYDVIRASSGPQAIQILQNTPLDLVILDIMMPDMNGFAVLEIIRSMPGLKTLPVIIETAYPSQEHGHRVVDSGLEFMLAKPLDLELLVTIVEKYLDNSTIKAGQA